MNVQEFFGFLSCLACGQLRNHRERNVAGSVVNVLSFLMVLSCHVQNGTELGVLTIDSPVVILS